MASHGHRKGRDGVHTVMALPSERPGLVDFRKASLRRGFRFVCRMLGRGEGIAHLTHIVINAIFNLVGYKKV